MRGPVTVLAHTGMDYHLLRHSIQDTLPAHSRSFSYEWQYSAKETEHKVIAIQENIMSYYNKAAHPLSDIKQGLCTGDLARIKLWDTYVWRCHFC